MAGPRKPTRRGAARQSLGRQGEALAGNYLEKSGYKILERNYRSPFGEVDLIARQPEGNEPGGESVLVFVEVKTRSSAAYGFPEESITPAKQVHLVQTAQAYLQDHPELEGNWRIDIITVRTFRSGGPAEIEHFENAVH